MRRELALLLTLAGLGLAGPAGVAVAAEEQVQATAGEDHFAAGDRVTVEQPVSGDSFIAAGRSDVRGRIAGDAVLTGGEVDLSGDVGEDVYAAGGLVRVNSKVEGSLRLAGGSLKIGPDSDVRGSASLAGGSLDIEGRIGRALKAYGDSVRLDAEVGGDVEITADEVVIGPKARVAGRLVYRSPNEARVDPAAQLTGGIERREQSLQRWDWHSGWGQAASAVGQFFWFVGVLLLGTVVVFAFPAWSREAAALARTDPLASMVLGFAVLVAVPVGIVLCFITLIGIPLGIAAIFGYGLLLMLGYLNAALAIGDVLLGRLGEPRAGSAGWRVAFLLLALVALLLLRQLPWVGGAIVFLAFIAGLGAWTMRLWRGYARPAAA